MAKKTAGTDKIDYPEQALLDVFVGEYVEILAACGAAPSPIVVQSFILDVHKGFLFLGELSGKTDAIVKLKDVVYMKIIEEKSKHQLLLEDLSIPDDEDEVN